MPTQFDPPSGTRDFLAAEWELREHAFARIRSVFARYGFEPLVTPAFERLDVLLGKYGDEGDKLIFKILRRGEHEGTGEADLALRYDHTVPLARVAAAYGSQLPTPYKRYAIGSVWRADRPGHGRYRELTQCDVDTLGATSAMADAEVMCAVHDVLDELGLRGFKFLLNSRRVLAGLLEAFGVPAELGPGVLITLDKLDKLAPGEVIAELAGRGLAEKQAAPLVGALTAGEAAEQIRDALKSSDEGAAGLDEVNTLLSLVTSQVPVDRVTFTPRLVRGLSYYTGPIWEIAAEGGAGSLGGGGRYDHLIEQLGGPDVPATGGSLGLERILLMLPRPEAGYTQLDVAVTVIDEQHAARSFGLAAAARHAGLRASVYLGNSKKLGRQLKWASDSGARWAMIYGSQEEEANAVTVRDMATGEQAMVPLGALAMHLVNLVDAFQPEARRGEAIPSYARNFADSVQVLGPDHPDTLAARGNLAQAYQLAGQLDEAIALQQENLADSERVLGPDHPDTLAARGNLAHAYRSAGRLGEAIRLYEQNLADSERVLGPNHPSTVTARHVVFRVRNDVD